MKVFLAALGVAAAVFVGMPGVADAAAAGPAVTIDSQASSTQVRHNGWYHDRRSDHRWRNDKRWRQHGRRCRVEERRVWSNGRRKTIQRRVCR